MMSISPDIHILTTAELEAIKNAFFQRGVERGRFEQASDYAKMQKECKKESE